jgi:hypothetical protein
MNVSGKLETAANLSTIAASVFLSAVVAKVYLIPTNGSRPRDPLPGPAVGRSVKGQLSGVDWQRNGRTLVLALSTRCRLCTESAPFLRRLADEAGKSMKIVAVFPQPVTEAEQYMKAEGVRVDQVKQAAPGSMGIRGTPTILLVNERAVVTNVWEGKIDAQQQTQVLGFLLGEGGWDPPAASAEPFAATGKMKNSKRE